MKKVLFGLSALLMCLMMTSCGDPIAKIEGLIEDIKADGKNWDVDQWENAMRDLADYHLAFWESEPTKAEIKAFDKLADKFEKAAVKATKSKKAQKAAEKAYKHLDKDKEFKALTKRIDKLEKKARRAANKRNRDDGDDDDDEDDDDDDDSYDSDDDEDED